MSMKDLEKEVKPVGFLAFPFRFIMDKYRSRVTEKIFLKYLSKRILNIRPKQNDGALVP